MHKRGRRPHCLRRRAGLAPLELVLSLPLMLFVMALMIIFGTAGAWKVRTLVNSRQAAWRALEPRTGNNDPYPQGWSPEYAEMTRRRDAPPIVATDPYARFRVVRGPWPIPVREDILDMTAGSYDGFARVERNYPIFDRLPPGRFSFPRNHFVLDGTRWQYPTMRIPSNLTRRILFLYEMDLLGWNAASTQQLTQRYMQAAMAVYFNPHKPALIPLEGGDPEILDLLGIRTPDRQPKIPLGAEQATIPALGGRMLRPTVCEADAGLVRAGYVEPLKERIAAVPLVLTDDYIRYYTQAIARLQGAQPPPPGSAALIQELEDKIGQLSRFRATLLPIQ